MDSVEGQSKIEGLKSNISETDGQTYGEFESVMSDGEVAKVGPEGVRVLVLLLNYQPMSRWLVTDGQLIDRQLVAS